MNQPPPPYSQDKAGMPPGQYPSPAGQYPPQPQPGYPPQGYPAQSQGYAPPQQPGYPPQQGGYATTQPQGYATTTNTTIIAQQPAVIATMPVIFNEFPVSMTCPSCHAQIVSAVQYEPGTFAWLLFFLMCIFA